MARPKGALNRRTRAALSAAKEGELGKDGDKVIEFLMDIAKNSDKPESLRMQAAKIALPYLKPALSSVEQTVIEPAATTSEADLMASLKEAIKAHPGLVQEVLAEQAREQQATPKAA